MKTISLNFTCTVFGFLMLLLLTPLLAEAAENDSNLPSQIEVNVLNDNSEKAPILDVEINDLLGIDNIDVEIPNANGLQNSNEEEKLVNVSVVDEEIGNLEVDVLSQTESTASSEQAVVDITAEDLIVADDVNVEVLKQEESSTETSYSNKSAVADITAEDLVVTNDANIEVLGQEEFLTETASSKESAVVDIASQDLVIADDVNVEVLKQEESSTETFSSNKSAVADLTAEDLVVTDDANIEVLGQEESLTETAYSSEVAVVDAELAPNIIADQIDLEVLADKEYVTKDSTTEETMNLEEGVHLKITNVPVVEAIHVGVLESQTSASNEGFAETSSLLNVKTEDENPNFLLNDLELNVLPISDSNEGESEQSSSSVASLETVDGLLGDLSADVLLSRWTSDENTNMFDSGLVELVSDQFPITDQMHIGILDYHEMNGINEQYSNDGVLQVDILSDQLDELTVDVLTNDYYSNSEGSFESNNGISFGVNNDLLQNTNVQILAREEFVAALPINSPNNSGESEGGSPENGEENTPVENEVPALVDEGAEEVYADASGNDNMNEDTNSNTDPNASMNTNEEETADDSTTETAANNEEEQDDASLFGNLNDISFNGSEMQDGSMLPRTGGFFDGMLLMLLALSLLASGLTIRKFA
ncbi:hypothetical protein [Psychrobacillus sp. NPDC096389]|uniref:hypothetical protein n=1 Tax=Psychrobacillus sp. NPDC096389 TaxID=3364490 RepID=UPI003827FC04